MTRIMQLSDIAVEGVRLPGVDMVNGCEATRKIDEYLRDYCLSMHLSANDRLVTGISETPNGYWRVEYRAFGRTEVYNYALFFRLDGAFHAGPTVVSIRDMEPFAPPKPRKDAWYLTTGKADLEWENQP